MDRHAPCEPAPEDGVAALTLPPALARALAPRPLPTALARWFQPVVVLGAFGLFVGLHGHVDPHVRFATLLYTSITLITLVEWVFPARPEWRVHARASAVDVAYLVGGAWLWGPALYDVAVRPLVAAAVAWRHDLVLWPTEAPFVVRVVLSLVLGELFGWLLHVAQHNNALLWRFHATHHVSVGMNWLKGPVNHPLETILLSGVKALPLAMLGAGWEDNGGAILLGMITNTFAHANLALAPGWIGWVFTTPGQHLRHHSLDITESRSNYGCSIIVFDRLFGTFGGEADRASARLGIEDGRRFGVWEQLWLPFKRAVREGVGARP